VVSETYRGEYEAKLEEYRQLEIRYYVVYNPLGSRQHDPLEVYELVEGNYIRLPGEPVWLSGIGLGIGRGEGEFGGWRREWLYWYDESGERYLTPEEYEQYRADLAEQRADLAEQQVEQLKQRLKDLGVEPEAG
ncbi:MAG: Uma2 family endonuclease, partial [Gemmatimonadaceae bacterium]|nr:Uma2 family endonuclease [Gloeobacterales cyanobacterium ES-bin-141]